MRGAYAPRTGRMRTLKSSNAWSSLTELFWNSSSGKGRSFTSPGTSVEYTTLDPGQYQLGKTWMYRGKRTGYPTRSH